MSRGMAYAGLVCGVLAIMAGLFALFFDNYISPYLDYDSSLYTLSTLGWFLNTLLVGLAVCFVALAVIARPVPGKQAAAAQQPPLTSPPPLPSNVHTATPMPFAPRPPVEQTDKAVESLEQPSKEPGIPNSGNQPPRVL